MRALLPWLLCCWAAAQTGARPLSDFNLTEPELEHYGFIDTDAGLKDTIRNALYTGKDREAILEQIEKWGRDEQQRRALEAEDRAQRNQAQAAAVAPLTDEAVKMAQGADGQSAAYDGQAKALDSGDAVIAEWKARQKTRLEPSSAHDSEPPRVPAPVPQSQTALPLGLQGRGTVDKIIGLVMQNLPGPDLADVARRLTWKATGASSPAKAGGLGALCRAESQSCLNELLSQYYGERKASVGADDRNFGFLAARGDDALFVRYGQGQKSPGEYIDAGTRLQEAQAQQLIALGFRRELGLGEGATVRVIFSPDAGVSKNRGVWLSNPVLRRRDGSFDLIFSEKVVANAAGRTLDLAGALKAAPAAEREHIMRDVLAGDDPIAMGNRLNCVLLGWMQAETLRRLEEGALAGKTDEEARRSVQDAVVADPLKSRLYAVASNSQITDRWASFESQRLNSLDEDGKARDSDIWAMVAQANAGDARAEEAFFASLKARHAAIGKALEAAKRANQEIEKGEEAWRSLPPETTTEQADAMRRKVDAAYLASTKADEAVAQARWSWERAIGYLDYLHASLPEKVAQELDLPPEYRAAQDRRLVQAGDQAATERFAAALVSGENAAAQASYQDGPRDADAGAPRPPEPRSLDEKDRDFLGAFLKMLYARASLRSDYGAIVAALFQAKGQRLYDAVLARDNGFWPKFLETLSKEDAAALYAKAPDAIKAKMAAALSVSQAPAARALLDALGARPAPGADLDEERLLERASRLTGQFSVLDAAAQKVESRYNAYPMMIMEYLQEPDVLGPILEASRRTGMDPYLITAVAFQEGYNVFAEAVEKGEGTGKTYYFHSMVGPMGLDTFPGTVEEMKKRGWIRPDFSDYRIVFKPLGWGDYGDAQFTGPEPAEAALEGMVGLIRKKRAQFLGDAGRLNIPVSHLSRQELELWTYLYFNFSAPKKLLANDGTGWVWRPAKPGEDVYNVKRVGATAQWLRELKFFDGFWAADKLGH